MAAPVPQWRTSFSKKCVVESRLDNKNDIYYPLDYSFKMLGSFEELLRVKQRLRGQQGEVSLEIETSEEESEVSLDLTQSKSTALKLNNNMLTNWPDFKSTIDKLFVDPAKTLAWLDFSFNDFRTIDCVLLTLPNLSLLYLHGNNIFSISEVDKLVVLENLKSLTLHGNPVEASLGYRHYIISLLPQLQKFDFSRITNEDRITSKTWKTMIVQKPSRPEKAKNK